MTESTEKSSFDPAGRLHLLLLALQTFPGTTPLRDAWSKVFCIDPENRSKLFEQLAMVVQLVDQVEVEVKKVPDANHRLYLTGIPELRSAVTITNLDNNNVDVVARFANKTVLSHLEFCSELLKKYTPELKIDQLDLDQFLNLVLDLKNMVNNIDFEIDVKIFLINYIDGLERVVRFYPILGLEGIRKESINLALIVSAFGKPMKDKSGWSEFTGQVEIVMDKVQTFSRFVKAGLTLTTVVKGVLGPAHHDINKDLN